MHALTLIIVTLLLFAIAYRFYAKFIITKVLVFDANRPTPAHTLRDGKDYDPTNRYVLFGHHFAAIAGAGPLVGPVLAAQFGYLPGVLWILIGAVLGGAVHDMVILFASVRMNGLSLTQLAREHISRPAGIATAFLLIVMAFFTFFGFPHIYGGGLLFGVAVILFILSLFNFALEVRMALRELDQL